MEATRFYSACRSICRLTTSLAFDLKVYGQHHVPMNGGVMIASNHQSYLDPVLIAAQLKRPLSFLAKSELFENPYFGWLIRNLNAYPVKQGAGDVGAVKETIRRLQEGHGLHLFPEGSRCEDGQIAPIQPGIGLIVRRAGVPVVPAAIDGSFQSWPKWRTLPRIRPIRVLYGPPMQLADCKPAEIVRRIDVTLRDLLARLREMERAEGIEV